MSRDTLGHTVHENHRPACPYIYELRLATYHFPGGSCGRVNWNRIHNIGAGVVVADICYSTLKEIWLRRIHEFHLVLCLRIMEELPCELARSLHPLIVPLKALWRIRTALLHWRCPMNLRSNESAWSSCSVLVIIRCRVLTTIDDGVLLGG